MSSSDSSDEDLSKFAEAADYQFINDDMFKSNQQKPKEHKDLTKLPSLRPQKDDNNQFNVLPTVTPEFRNYVSKQLSQIIEKQLTTKISKEPNKISKKKSQNKQKRQSNENNGIKLFRDSTDYVEINTYDNQTQTINKRPKLQQNSDNEDDYEKFKTIAVNPDDILSEKETKHWSNRSKAPVYRYKRTVEGKLIEIPTKFT